MFWTQYPGSVAPLAMFYPNTFAPWKRRSWWGRRQPCPTCPAASLLARPSPPPFPSQLILAQTLHFHFLLLSALPSWLLWCWWSTWLSGSSRMLGCEGKRGSSRPLPTQSTTWISIFNFQLSNCSSVILLGDTGCFWKKFLSSASIAAYKRVYLI